MTRDSSREILAFLTLGAAAFLLVSLYTRSGDDLFGAAGGSRNFCGPAGDAASAWIIRWLGKAGAYGATGVLAVSGLLLFFRRALRGWGWKCAGAALFLLSLSIFEVAVFNESGSPRHLAGGYIGYFLFDFFFANLSTFGTYLLLALVIVVAFIVSTDTVFYPAFAHTQRAVLDGERWNTIARGLTRGVAVTRGRLRSLRLGRVFRRARGGSGAPSFRSRPRNDSAGAPSPVHPEPEERKAAHAERARGPEPGAGGGGLPSDELEGSGRKATARHDPRPGQSAPEPVALAQDDVPAGPAETGASEPDPEVDGDEPSGAPGAGAEPECERPPLKIRLPEPLPAAPRPQSAAPRAKGGPYRMPPLTLIEATPSNVDPLDRDLLERTAGKIEETLRDFKIDARVVEVQKGPTVTQFEISLAAGIKVHKIINLSDDLAMALKAPSIRIIAPIPGKSTVGLEVPNRKRTTVSLRELIEAAQGREDSIKLPLALGRDTAGMPVIGDLGEMPHLLIAGSTGSGKSVCINSIITTFLLTKTPDEVKLILVDPKMVELAQFENIPHLMCPVVTDMKKAPAVLYWLVEKMEERYELLAMAGVRHISSFNALGRERLRERLDGKLDPEAIEMMDDFLPFMVVIIDELADLMMTASKEVEASITRLSQKSRAVGIHVILATQRPSVDVITGLIKANMPSRISFRVASRVDSRTILDRNGAEKLLGKGDMLYLPPGTSEMLRVQGTFISDKEIRDVVQYAAREAQPHFHSELTRFGVDGAVDGAEEDELYEQAVEIVLGSQRGSVTLLQRQLQIGYTRASRLMELMCEQGLVGPFKGSKAREVYYTLEEYEKAKARAGLKESQEG